MLSTNNSLKLKELMKQHPELKEIINEMNEETQFTVSNIAHEIRNPLTLINSSLQLIQTQHPEVIDYRFWSQTMEDIVYLRNLLDELSTFNNGSRISKTSISLEKFLNPIQTSFQASYQDTQKEFSCHIAANLPHLYCDAIKLRQAVTNLLVNAFESIDVMGTVSLVVCLKENRIVFQIKDTGSGIEQEQWDTLFTPFITHKQNGTGLGLAISKRVVEAHNGSITVNSKVGEGTVFTIELPLDSDVSDA